jgi:hypothetical protein
VQRFLPSGESAVPDHDHEHGRPDEWAEVHQLKHIVAELKEINSHLSCICKALQPTPATDFRLVQQGDSTMAITGVQVGSSAAFQIFLVPANAASLQSGPVATSDDPNVSISPNTNDPTNPFMIVCTVATGDTNASFNLKVDGVNSVGAPITHTFVIPILQAPPPAAVDFDLDQLAVSPLK